ncbi:DUF935 domain-containing protein [Litorisediminicola beolgyonensis]|uniref:DUF935 domain-containing protein n=1 Tax=Litorisediminicola beolgyonensis TaxID=1173614 RepID=A0ABW3ZI92_9RHOB
MANRPQLLDRWGKPVRRSELGQEIAAPTFGGVRSPLTGYPGDGLDPRRLAAILREADAGDPIRYMELAEVIEERDPHYLGVLGTRRRSVSQIEVTVEPGGDDALDEDLAQMVRDWLKRDELTEELFDILDAIGKGYSHTEIIWDTSSGQWMPERLERRDPRWFRFMRHDLATPIMLGPQGEEIDYPGFKFIFAQMKAKSGLPLRSGLARVATWNWLFKAFTQRDWTIFTQTYGQPLRVGKYGAGSTKEDQNTLFRAVANIGGDCAAIIPESMMIDFVEAQNVGSSTEHYERRSDWLDKQISKAVLGQTATTDAETGGLGSGKEHREVQKDIELADCRSLAAILNRDLIRPWIQLERGPQLRYPRLVIERTEEEDLKAWSDAIGPLVDRGLPVPISAVRDKFQVPEPKDGEEILRPSAKSGPQRMDEGATGDAMGSESAVKYPLNGRYGSRRGAPPEIALQASEGRSEALAFSVDRLVAEGAAVFERMLLKIEAMLETSSSLPEFRDQLLSAFPALDEDDLTELMAQALSGAHLAGRAEVEEESGG